MLGTIDSSLIASHYHCVRRV